MAPTKIYELTTTNLMRTKAELREENSTNPTYTLDFSISPKRNRHAIILRTASPSSSKDTILGTCNLTCSLNTPIHLGFGDALNSPQTVLWEDIHVKKKYKKSAFELNIDLGPEIGRKVFEWKRTHRVNGKKTWASKLDAFHLKMVEKESDAVVARFVHHAGFGRKRGRVEFEDFESGRDWEVVVLLSGLATLEYLRRSS